MKDYDATYTIPMLILKVVGIRIFLKDTRIKRYVHYLDFSSASSNVFVQESNILLLLLCLEMTQNKFKVTR